MLMFMTQRFETRVHCQHHAGVIVHRCEDMIRICTLKRLGSVFVPSKD